MSAAKEPIKLRIPRQDLAHFDLFGLSVEQCTRWADGVAMGNAGKAATALRNAIAELNRVKLEPPLRFELLEALRPRTHLALSNLSRYYLNQPVALPEEPRKAARLAQSLNETLATGYTIVGVETIQRRDKLGGANPARLVCQAVHRAITSASRRLLISYQLYQPHDVHSWEELHQLYLLALRQKLTTQVVSDEIFGSGSVRDTYLRSLMMGCCKSNQLRQRDLASVFAGLADWVRHARLLAPGEGNALFLVDLARSHPPVYASLHKDASADSCRLIDTDELVKHLEGLREQIGERPLMLDKDHSVSANVLDHLANAWGIMSKRNFTRAPGQEKLWVSVGLINTHYYVSGGIPFDELTGRDIPADLEEDAQEEEPDNPFLVEETREADVWDRAFDAESEVAEFDRGAIEFHIRESDGHRGDGPDTERHPVFPVRMVNVSPGGYCLEWSEDIPSHIKTGDVVAVREIDNPGWSVAVIRWVSQLRDETTMLGVELLSPRAMPCGARVQHKTGDEGELLRALLLPEIKLVGQPATLLTPRVGFRERQKVTLIKDGEESYVQLFKKVSSSAAYNQFEFRPLQHLDELAMRHPTDSAFESLWNKL